MDYIPPFGASPSTFDPRTINHGNLVTFSPSQSTIGGYDYLPVDIEHQHKVGICTAISLTQNAAKALSKKFSADFQYLLQKKFVDGNWYEGSSIFSALKVGKNYGFLPVELFPYVSEEDRKLTYSQYIAKLQSISDVEIQRLLTLCTDKLQGYAQIKTDSQSIAKAIGDSKSGILCMYEVGEEWYTAPDGHISWATVDINPMRPPKVPTSGHAITYSKFNYTVNMDGIHANTWGTDWNKQGLCDILLNTYTPREAWIPYYGLTQAQILEIRLKIEKAQLTLVDLLRQWLANIIKSK